MVTRKSFISRWATVFVVLALLSVGMTVTAQESITPGTPVEGTYSGDEVLYSVDVSAGQLILASMVSEEFNTQVKLYDGETEIAADNDSGEGTNALLAYVAQADGTFNIAATASFFDLDSGMYTLTVDVVDPVVLDLDSPTVLTPAGEGSSHLYAVFNASAGDVVDIWAGTVGEEEDVRAELYDINSASIESDDDDGPGDDALIRRVVLPDDGIYLITLTNSRSDTLLLEGVEVTVNSTEQLFLSPEPQEMILGDGEGHHGTEVFTVDVEAGVTYTFSVTIESMPDDTSGLSIELLDTEFFFEPDLDTMHMTAVSWSWLSNTTGQIRLNVHPNFFGTDIETINYTISMEVDG